MVLTRRGAVLLADNKRKRGSSTSQTLTINNKSGNSTGNTRRPRRTNGGAVQDPVVVGKEEDEEEEEERDMESKANKAQQNGIRLVNKRPRLSRCQVNVKGEKNETVKREADEDAKKQEEKDNKGKKEDDEQRNCFIRDEQDDGSSDDSEMSDVEDELPKFVYEYKPEKEDGPVSGDKPVNVTSGPSSTNKSSNNNISSPVVKTRRHSKLFQLESFFDQVADEDLNVDIPLVDLGGSEEMNELKYPLLFERLERRASKCQYWPMKPDDSTTFSVLLRSCNATPMAVTSTTSSSSNSINMATSSTSTSQLANAGDMSTNDNQNDNMNNNNQDNDHGNNSNNNSNNSNHISITTPNLSDFVDESLTDDSDEASEASSPDSRSASPIDWTDKYSSIPICGFRNRYEMSETVPVVPPAKARLLAALSSIADMSSVHYQQALLIASGLNKRSLWTGMARQMVGGTNDYDEI